MPTGAREDQPEGTEDMEYGFGTTRRQEQDSGKETIPGKESWNLSKDKRALDGMWMEVRGTGQTVCGWGIWKGK